MIDEARRLIIASHREWDDRPAEIRFSREAWMQFCSEVEPWLVARSENMQDTFMGVPISACDQAEPIIALPCRRQREAPRSATLADLLGEGIEP